jgi:hypothetical protein
MYGMNIAAQFPSPDLTGFQSQRDSLKAGLEPLAAFAERVERVEQAMEALEELTGDSAKRSLARLQRELKEFEPAVTFLGQVKSGKTTLVNAMAGWADLLPTDVNPWTSVVTSLHLTPGSQAREISARFQLMKEEEWDRLVQKGGRLGELANRAGAGGELDTIRKQIETLREKSRRRLGKKFELLLGQEHEYGYFDKNLLERYICLGDDFFEDDAPAEAENQGRFADITRSADLYLSSRAKPFRMCLRDTPGVNDTFMMREQVTINAVRSSRICVVVLSAHQALTSIDMALIRMISSLKSRDVVIFVNRIDELKDPSNQIPEIEKNIREVLTKQDGPDDARIIFGSAYWANKVLSDNIEGMAETSATSLLNWAEKELDAAISDYPPIDMIWHLSGLPKLQEIISERIVTTLGEPKLRKIAASAVTIASGQQAANKVRIEGDASGRSLSMHEIRGELAALANHHTEALAQEIGTITESYQSRADRAHNNFIDRAVHSLVKHLEDSGDTKVWSYSPTGLRMLLRSAYSVFASRAQNTANKRYEAAVVDVAELYFKAFGNAVEGIQLSVPEAQDLPAPVTIAQTIALDFNDGWWVSWWRRTRGYKAFAKQFHSLISAETEDFMEQLKSVQTAEILAQLQSTLAAFIDQNRDIMFEIGGALGDKDGVQRMCWGAEEADRAARIDEIVDNLQTHSLLPETEAAA